MRAFLLSLTISLILFCAAWMAGTEALIRRKVDPLLKQHLEVEQKSLANYLEDLEFLRKQDILAQSFDGRKNIGKDAGEELNHLMHWVPEQKNFNQRPLVPAGLQDRILRLGKNWSLHTTSFKYDFIKKKLSLELFDSFEKYDYWDIEKNSPISELIEQSLYVAAEEIPAIDSLDLIALSKLRLLHAVFEKDYLKALADVRKLVSLLLTTENFRLELTALSILEVEHTASVLFLENKWITPEDWKPIDGNITRRAGRSIRATRGYLRFWTPVPILKQIFLTAQSPIGFCSAINDSLPQEWAMKSEMQPQLPFERNYQDHFEILQKIYERASTECHLNYLSHLKQNDSFRKIGGSGVFDHLPYTRKLFGLTMSLSHFEGFKDYQEAGSHPVN
jgi:hypothetical protein